MFQPFTELCHDAIDLEKSTNRYLVSLGNVSGNVKISLLDTLIEDYGENNEYYPTPDQRESYLRFKTLKRKAVPPSAASMVNIIPTYIIFNPVW